MSPEQNRTTQLYIYALIVLTLLCIVGAIYKKKKTEKVLLERAYENAQRKLRSNAELTPSENAALNRSSELPDGNKIPAKYGMAENIRAVDPEPVLSAKDRLSALSAESVSEFSRTAHIELEPPGSFKFHSLDLEDGFAGIYGVDSGQGAKLTGLAYNQVATEEQVVAFLKSDADSFPNLANNPIAQMSAPEKLPPPNLESGFSGASVWNGKLQNGDSVAAVLIERADKKGSYLFVLSGPDAYFKNNDGAFDSIYERAKALNAQEK